MRAASLPRVRRPEPSLPLVVIPSPAVINAQGGIELLTGEEIVVERCASGVDQVAEGILVVGVGDRAVRVGHHFAAQVGLLQPDRRAMVKSDELEVRTKS